MTSLVSNPQISLSLSYDCQSSDSLFKVWKVTRDKDLACLRSSTLRLNNRSWRLLNDRLLHPSAKQIDNSYLNLTDLLLDIPQISPLVPKDSKSTGETKLSLDHNQQSDPGEESSDISEYESDYSGDDLDLKADSEPNPPPSVPPLFSTVPADGLRLHPSRESSIPSKEAQDRHRGPEADSKNIFFIANTPSPDGNRSYSRFPDLEDNIQLSDTKNVPGIKRQDSLFGPTNFNSNAAASQLSLSSTDISEEDEYSSHDEMGAEVFDGGAEQLNSKSTVSKSSKSQQSVGDESEWLSVSSESESTNDVPTTQPLNFTKRIPIVSRKLTESKESTSCSDSKKDSPSNFRSRSLLSGLFLSDLASNSSPKSPFPKPSLGSLASKPVLKRSSTTGFMTFDKTKQLKETTKLQKPSILYSKRFASLSDVTKKPSDYRSPVLFIEEEDNVKHSEDTLDEEHLYTKQASSVSLSNFMVTAHASNLGMVKPNSPSPEVPGNAENAEALLSSSLNKYSNLQSVASLKNIFSKSSLHLTTLFGQARKGRPGQMRTTSSSESLKFQKNNISSSKDASGISPVKGTQSPQSPRGYGILGLPSPSKLTSMDHSGPTKIDVKVLHQVDFEPSIEISESLRNSLLIDHKLGKIPKPERIISEELLFGGQDVNGLPDESDDYHSKGW